MISSAEAALLISGYKSESKVLRTVFTSRDASISMRLTASVWDFVEGERLILAASNGDHCLVVLSGCTFAYGDNREAPESIRELAKFEGRLTVLFPKGGRLDLLEMCEPVSVFS